MDVTRPSIRPLSALKPGESAIIERLEGIPAVMMHLLELGLAPGERVTLRRVAPCGGPLEIELMDYRLAIRRSEASKIMVFQEEDL